MEEDLLPEQGVKVLIESTYAELRWTLFQIFLTLKSALDLLCRISG